MPDYRGMAQAVEGRGRYGDDILVHMNPAEVAGLASLSPTGSLTTNPDTGQPEAFLPFLLPVLGGIGGSMLGPTLGLSAVLGGALGSGLGSFAATGDLGRGLMSGLLGFGLGSALSGLSSAGAEGALQAGGAELAELAPTVDAGIVGDVMGDGLVPASGSLSDLVSKAPIGEQLSLAGQGLSQPGALMGAAKDFGVTGLTGLAGLASGAAETPKYEFPTRSYRDIPESFPEERIQNIAPANYRHGVNPEFDFFRYGGRSGYSHAFADGGMVDGGEEEQIIIEAELALQGQHPNPEAAIKRFVQVFGEAALIQLQNKIVGEESKARSGLGALTRGPGDGASDSIPANIDGMQPAALSSGEFVVPSDAVSGLGNGDTNSGAKKLQAMVDNIRMNKTGTPQQPQKVNAGSVMPRV